MIHKLLDRVTRDYLSMFEKSTKKNVQEEEMIRLVLRQGWSPEKWMEMKRISTATRSAAHLNNTEPIALT